MADLGIIEVSEGSRGLCGTPRQSGGGGPLMLDMGGAILINLGEPEQDRDVVTRAYVDSSINNMIIDGGIFT